MAKRDLLSLIFRTDQFSVVKNLNIPCLHSGKGLERVKPVKNHIRVRYLRCALKLSHVVVDKGDISDTDIKKGISWSILFLHVYLIKIFLTKSPKTRHVVLICFC